MYNIENKVIAITGGVSGIGYAIAEKFLVNSAKVTILLDINEAKGLKAVEMLTTKYGVSKAVFIHCDVRTDLKEVSAKITNEYGTVDVLVNSAGIAAEVIPKKIVDLNLLSLINWTCKFKECMSKTNGKNGGTILNIASVFGLTPVKELPVYCATKYGTVGFSRSLGHESHFQETQVRIIAVCPSFTRTELVRDRDEKKETEISKLIEGVLWQDADVVGDAVVEIFKKADSGTAWVVDNGNVSEFVSKDYVVKRQK